MKIEERKGGEGSSQREVSKNLLKCYSAQQGGSLVRENAKVIKLIHRKMYPLNYGQKSALVFPKLKERWRAEGPEGGDSAKKYTQISMEDQGDGLPYQARTDLETEQKYVGRSKTRKTTHKYRVSKPKDTLESQSPALTYSHSSNLSEIIHIDRSLISDHNRDETIYGESWENAQFFHAEGQRILNEAAKHSDFLKKMKQDIQKRKETYYHNVNFTEVFDIPAIAQKQNYSIQYLLNSMQKKSTRNAGNAPYEGQSPNKLGQFAKLFEKKSRNLMLWEELAEPVLQREKSLGQELKNSGQLRRMNRNQTIIEEQSDISMDNAYAAKYRIKNNHKRLIRLAMGKGV